MKKPARELQIYESMRFPFLHFFICVRARLHHTQKNTKNARPPESRASVMTHHRPANTAVHREAAQPRNR